MSILFSPGRLGPLALKNRIVRCLRTRRELTRCVALRRGLADRGRS